MRDAAVIMVSSLKYGPQECLVDLEDFENLSQYTWTIKQCTHSLFYAHTPTGNRKIGRSSITMHRMLLGNPKGIVDHINGNCLDNRKINLRVVSYSENRRNSAKQIKTKCKFRGVYERMDYPGKYRVQVRHDGKIHNLGTFTCPIEASLVYDSYVRTHYGEFAVTNFPA